MRFQHLIVKMAAALAAIFVCMSSVHAQPIQDESQFPKAKLSVEMDLTGNGLADRLQIFALNQNFDILSFETGLGEVGQEDFYPESAFVVPVNLSDFESLNRTASNAVQLNWGCFACGRYHSHSSITVRYQNHELTVIGYDTVYADRIYAAVFSCSVNLLTGNAIVTADDIETLHLKSPERAIALREFDWGTVPLACAQLDKYDHDFMEKHFGEFQE